MDFASRISCVTAKRFKVFGLVHGVFFRAETQKKSQELDITGWVRNCDDGSVEVYAQGEEFAMKELESWLHHGPEAAQVTDVQSEEVPPQNRVNFSILQ